jgi:hypothetical protein
MIYKGPRKRVGSNVERCDNPRHKGVIVAIFGTAPGAPGVAFASAATFRVLWDNGWREDCDDDEIQCSEAG